MKKEDIQERKLPKNTMGLVITEISPDSPIKFLQINNVIVEAQKKKIKSINELKSIINNVLKSKEKTIFLAIYNNQNQRRYIGIDLN